MPEAFISKVMFISNEVFPCQAKACSYICMVVVILPTAWMKLLTSIIIDFFNPAMHWDIATHNIV